MLVLTILNWHKLKTKSLVSLICGILCHLHFFHGTVCPHPLLYVESASSYVGKSELIIFRMYFLAYYQKDYPV